MKEYECALPAHGRGNDPVLKNFQVYTSRDAEPTPYAVASSVVEYTSTFLCQIDFGWQNKHSHGHEANPQNDILSREFVQIQRRELLGLNKPESRINEIFGDFTRRTFLSLSTSKN
jgi:hypothetical protein